MKIDGMNIMRDCDGDDYVVIPEYPDDNYWRIGTLHMVRMIPKVDSGMIAHSGEIGEVVRHGRDPATHRKFAELVVLSETAGIPLDNEDYSMLIDEEGPVLRFSDGQELWYPGMCTSFLTAITGDDPETEFRRRSRG